MIKIFEDKVKFFANRYMYIRWTEGEKHTDVDFQSIIVCFFENGGLGYWGKLHTKKLALKQNKIIEKDFAGTFSVKRGPGLVGKTSICLVSTIKNFIFVRDS